MHTENIIMNENGIIIIDTDLYTFNKYFNLGNKNLSALSSLYINLYLEALTKYHPEYNIFKIKKIIQGIFNTYNIKPETSLFEKINGYKYPIDYIRSKVR